HDDFYLATALKLGNPKAFDAFHRIFTPKLRATVERRAASLSSAVADDVLATIEDRLLVNGPEGMRIAHYSGRGPLLGFLRAAAVNQLMNRLRTPESEPLGEAVTSQMIDRGRSP